MKFKSLSFVYKNLSYMMNLSSAIREVKDSSQLKCETSYKEN